eukprot:TRINITY_DN22177_c0_g1_i1.p1 TRINITY_DN22177_c0_g1~~TRINITY_DN22177_c0_g1_i1.p1  ORF type:complete len:1024 (-),score=201.18 TRINITY_DN22177_c0_g1_i1:478-3549(-)
MPYASSEMLTLRVSISLIECGNDSIVSVPRRSLGVKPCFSGGLTQEETVSPFRCGSDSYFLGSPAELVSSSANVTPSVLRSKQRGCCSRRRRLTTAIGAVGRNDQETVRRAPARRSSTGRTAGREPGGRQRRPPDLDDDAPVFSSANGLPKGAFEMVDPETGEKAVVWGPDEGAEWVQPTLKDLDFKEAIVVGSGDMTDDELWRLLEGDKYVGEGHSAKGRKGGGGGLELDDDDHEDWDSDDEDDDEWEEVDEVEAEEIKNNYKSSAMSGVNIGDSTMKAVLSSDSKNGGSVNLQASSSKVLGVKPLSSQKSRVQNSANLINEAVQESGVQPVSKFYENAIRKSGNKIAASTSVLVPERQEGLEDGSRIRVKGLKVDESASTAGLREEGLNEKERDGAPSAFVDSLLRTGSQADRVERRDPAALPSLDNQGVFTEADRRMAGQVSSSGDAGFLDSLRNQAFLGGKKRSSRVKVEDGEPIRGGRGGESVEGGDDRLEEGFEFRQRVPRNGDEDVDVDDEASFSGRDAEGTTLATRKERGVRRDDLQEELRGVSRVESREEARVEAGEEAREEQRRKARGGSLASAFNLAGEGRTNVDAGQAEGYFWSSKSFAASGASDGLTNVLASLGIRRPSHIQAMSFKPILNGRDCVVADQTGSGKTLAYLAPIVQRIRRDEDAAAEEGGRPGRAAGKRPKALVLTPTGELAAQVLRVCRQLSDAGLRFRSQAVTGGGFPMRTQADGLKNGTELLIATPGRLLQHLAAGNVLLDDLQSVVVDEADIMYEDEDFAKALRSIRQLASNRERGPPQFVHVTATLPLDIHEALMEQYPGSISLMGPSLHRAAVGLQEVLVDCSGGEEKTPEEAFRRKREALLQVIDSRPVAKAIVFCNTIETCRKVENALLRHDRGGRQYSVVPYHGALTPEKRQACIQDFMKLGRGRGEAERQILVCTDRASRGVDSLDVEQVVLFDFPRDPSEYVRRVGRTARGAGGTGSVYAFVVGRQVGLARRIMSRNDRGLPIHEVPGGY